MSDATKQIADQLSRIFPLSNETFKQAHGIIEYPKNAVYSTHDIARHLLSMPDKEVEYGHDGIEIYEDDLGEPKRPYVAAVLTAEENRRREQLWGRLA